MRGLFLAIICALYASALAADNKFYRANAPLPPEVEANLPADVPARDVLVQDGCFYFLYEGKVFPLTQPETPKQPICAG